MKIRITGLPAEVEHAVSALTEAAAFDVLEVSDRCYPNRGSSRLVRVYADVQMTGEKGQPPVKTHAKDYYAIPGPIGSDS